MKKIFLILYFSFALTFLQFSNLFAFQIVQRGLYQNSETIEQASVIRPSSTAHFSLDSAIHPTDFTKKNSDSTDTLYAVAANESVTDFVSDASPPDSAQGDGGNAENESDFYEEEDEDFEDEFGDVEVEVYDPLSGYNRFMTSVNDGLYTWLAIPIAKGWEWLIPECIRRSFVRFFNNVLYPVRLVNNLLQGKFKNSGEETLRFTINTTIGILGFFDPAKAWFDLEAHPEDFGQTLGYWGVGPGPHVVIPFLGPSNLRDAFSIIPDWTVDPTTTPYVLFESLEDFNTRWAYWTFDQLNFWSLNYKIYENLKKDAIDLYPYLRDFYERSRQKEIEE